MAMQKKFLDYDKEADITQCTETFQVGETFLTLRLEAMPNALVSCQLLTDETSNATVSSRETNHPILKEAIAQLREYFVGNRSKFTIPLAPPGTDFQRQVWDATTQIPYGQTRSYWWVSVRMGNPYAMRAVGNALAANPLLLFIPCHRVVRQDGDLGGFAPGPSWKRFLLEHELRWKEMLCRNEEHGNQ
jgi:O-6-methylguanine DNA methyltransferase